MNLSLELQGQKLDIIIVSDLHLNFDNIDRLALKVKNSGYRFDYCLVGGDIANCDHQTSSHNQQEMVDHTKNILTQLHDILQCKVLWIPGNHDPLTYFNGGQHGHDEIINIHKREFVLDTGLRIVGLGGSLPAYADQQSKSQEWEGYPYKSQEEFSTDLEGIFKQDEIKTSKIYFTHTGPSVSSTTIDRKNASPVYAGSKALSKFLQNKDMLLLIHGHVHNGGRYDLFKHKPIVNPGALLYGDFAVLSLVRVQKTWNISKISFEKLI